MVNFLGYAMERGAFALTRDGVFVADGGEPMEKFQGNRLERTINGEKKYLPMLEVGPDSLWEGHMTSSTERIESRIRQNTAADGGPEGDRNRALAKALDCSPEYLRTLKMIIFDVGPYFTERKPGEHEENDPLSGRKAVMDLLKQKVVTGLLGGARIYTESLLKAKNLPDFREFFTGELVSIFYRNGCDGILYCENSTYALDRRDVIEKFSDIVKGGNNFTLFINSHIYREKSLDTWSFNPRHPQRIIDSYENYFVEAETDKRMRAMLKDMDKNDIAVLGALVEKRRDFRSDIDLGDWGVVLFEGMFKVYLKVPQYVLKEVNNDLHDYSVYGKYYLFPGVRVEIEVYQGGNFSNVFVDGQTSPFAYKNGSICMGNYVVPGNLEAPEKIAKYLMDAKKVILSGYTPYCSPVRKVYAVGTPITEKEIKSRGLVVTNEVD